MANKNREFDAYRDTTIFEEELYFYMEQREREKEEAEEGLEDSNLIELDREEV